jgi:hypothetical protein
MPSLHMDPQDGVGGATPMPMKDRKASVKMALGTAKGDGNEDDTHGIRNHMT